MKPNRPVRQRVTCTVRNTTTGEQCKRAVFTAYRQRPIKMECKAP
jgi:hypothetical protein